MTTTDAFVRCTLQPLFPDVTMPSELGGNIFSDPGNRIRPSVRHAERTTLDLDDASIAGSPAGAPFSTPNAAQDAELPRFGRELEPVLLQLFATPQVATEMMASASAQARALALVWEAHERGAISLPDGIARAISAARACVPRVCMPPSMR